MSKLYTEEQLRKAIDLSYSYGLAKPNSGRLSDIPNVQNKIIETLTPIQLPTDEEIGKGRDENISIDEKDMWSERFFFTIGARWMRDKIGGNK